MQVKHTGTIPLETGRLLLRPFRADDAEQIYKNWASDPEVAKFLTWRAHQNAGVTRTVVDSWLKDYRKPHGYHWCITLKGSDEPLDGIDVVSSDEHLAAAELGYCLTRRLWGQGYMTEAVIAVLEHLLETVGYERVSARHDTKNPASGAVMVKAGMAFEGVMRRAAKNNAGAYCDLALYAALRGDWARARAGQSRDAGNPS